MKNPTISTKHLCHLSGITVTLKLIRVLHFLCRTKFCKLYAKSYFPNFIDMLHFVPIYHKMQERLLENATVISSQNATKLYYKMGQVFYYKMG